MLGNKDFAQMVSSGSIGSGGGKVKFDLKQVSKWDRENQKQMHKKKHQPEFEPREKEKKEDWTTFGYRDRAEERRKGLNTEDEKLDEQVSKLDTDKTHILGGDVDHAHLVRGLDRALLQKVREDLELQKAVSSVQEEAPVDNQPKPLYIPIQVGARIPGITVAPPPAAGKDLVELKVTKKVAEEYAVSKKKRKERDETTAVDPSPVAPAAVKKPAPSNFSIYDDVVEKYVPVGAIDETTGEVLKVHDTPSSESTVIGRVGSSIFSTKSSFPSGFSASGGSSSIPPPPPPSSSSSSSSSSSAFVTGSGVQKNAAITGMFDGIYDTSKVGATSSWSSSTVATSSRSGSASENYSAFSKPSAAPVASSESVVSSEDLMKPVMALLHAQANKEKIAQEKLQQAASGASGASAIMARNNKIVIETDEQGRQLVHRDVFATTLDKVVKGTTIVGLNGKEGEVFGLHGTYEDVFPESAEYEVMSGDEDESEAPAKKPTTTAGGGTGGGDRGGTGSFRGSTTFTGTVGLEGSIKKNIVKNSLTPWSRGHGMSGSGGGGGPPAGSKTQQRPVNSSSTAAGMNSAARRAAGL